MIFWSLLLAHFVADFPAQPNWMADNKHRPPVLLLHAGAHLLVMLMLMGPAWRATFAGVLLLAGIHYGIDTAKLAAARRWPQWVVAPYLIDQGLHYLSIAAVALAMRAGLGPLKLLLPSQVAIYAIGYLAATYVWFITERILAHANPPALRQLQEQAGARMMLRAVLVSLFLALSAPLAAVSAASWAALPLPFLADRPTVRALLTDVAVALAAAAFIRLAL